MTFAGFCQLDDTFTIPVLGLDSSGVPTNSSTTPSYRVYGNNGLMSNGTGSLSFKDTGNITGATNASPIVITSAGHGLQTGMKVTVANVGGNTAANGTFTVTYVGANTFSLDGSSGNGAYTSGGDWKVTGLYYVSLTPTAGNGFAAGEFYDVMVNMTISADVVSQAFRFGVT